MTATPHLPFQSVESRFTVKSQQLYNSMAQRFKEKRDKRGCVLRVGRTVPFTLAQFRAWLLEQLGGENGVVKCTYCADWLSIDTMVLDHEVPIKQGGSLDLDNLDLICKNDNQAKGGMTGESYQRLLDWSATNLPPACRADMLHRLAIAVQLAAQKRWEIVSKNKKKSSPVPVAVEEDVPF